MRTAIILIGLITALSSFGQDVKKKSVQFGINLSSYASNETAWGIGSDLTLDFCDRHQFSVGTKVPFHWIRHDKTGSHSEKLGIVNASYKYFFLQKESGPRLYGVAQIEHTFWNYRRSFFYQEGDEIVGISVDPQSLDYSFNAKTVVGTKGLNVYGGLGVEVPIVHRFYFSGYAALGLGSLAVNKTLIDEDTAIKVINDYSSPRHSFVFQFALSLGFRFN